MGNTGTQDQPASGSTSSSGLWTQYTTHTPAAFETVPYILAGSGGGALTSGEPTLTAIALPAGLSIGHIGYLSVGTAMVTPAHWWFGLYDQNGNALAFTADQLAAAWGNFTEKELAIATTAAGGGPFVTTYTGLHFLAVMCAAATVPTLAGGPPNAEAAISPTTPILQGRGQTVLTAPPAFPSNVGALSQGGTASSSTIYGYVAA